MKILGLNPYAVNARLFSEAATNSALITAGPGMATASTPRPVRPPEEQRANRRLRDGEPLEGSGDEPEPPEAVVGEADGARRTGEGFARRRLGGMFDALEALRAGPLFVVGALLAVSSRRNGPAVAVALAAKPLAAAGAAPDEPARGGPGVGARAARPSAPEAPPVPPSRLVETRYADMRGGRDDETPALRATDVIALRGRSGGGRLVPIPGGLVALHLRPRGGEARIALAPGANLAIQLPAGADWSARRDGGAMLLDLADGALRIEGAAWASGVGVMLRGAEAPVMLQEAPALDRRI